MHVLTIDDVARELGKITSRSDARALVNRASRVAGLASNRPLELRQLLMVCHALAAEGGSVQQLAEQIAARSLGDDFTLDPADSLSTETRNRTEGR